MIYLAIFALVVVTIALVTNKLNAVTHCQHDWKDGDNSFKCCKCGKKIPDYTTAYATETYPETFRKAA